MQQQMQNAMAFMLIASAVGFGLGLWIGYLVMKLAIKNALIDSGLVRAVNRLADWQPRAEPAAELPTWAK